MSAIRLEKFIHPVRLDTGARLISHDEIEALKREAFEAGIREGADAASEAFSSEQSRSLSYIQEMIGDAFIAREEAHRAALTSFHPLLTSLVETLAPALGRAGLSYEIAEIVAHYAQSRPEDHLNIFVPEGMAKEVSKILENPSDKISVAEDSTLDPEGARIEWKDGFDVIDLSASAKAAENAIADFFSELDHFSKTKVPHAS